MGQSYTFGPAWCRRLVMRVSDAELDEHTVHIGESAYRSAMRSHHEFLNPRLLPATLDRFLTRRAILTALRAQLVSLHGTVLDIGCGNMPYKSLVLAPPSRARKYIGLDIQGDIYQPPDLYWSGRTVPLGTSSMDCALSTEVLEHCAEPEILLRETFRVLKPGGLFFLTSPFLWPLHDVPCDEYRYTPFALERHLRNCGFIQIQLRAMGGWDASLAQMIGLWVGRRPMSPQKRKIMSRLALPMMRYLIGHDQAPRSFGESTMLTGISGTAIKPGI